VTAQPGFSQRAGRDVDPSHHRGRIALLGAVHESLPMLQALLADPRADVVAVVTSRPSRGSTLCGSVDLGSVARSRGVPVLSEVDLRSAECLRILAAFELDLLVVVGWTRLVPPNVLALPKFGCVGFHASLLPRHRGRAPVNWAIIHGETQTGTTMLMLDPGADTGPIVDQRPISIGPDDTCRTVYDRVAAAGVDMMREQLPALVTGRAPRHEQRPDDGDVLPRRTPQMGITDWRRPVRDIHNWIRALTRPYPGAFSLLGGDVIRLWRAEPGPAASTASVPRAHRPGTFVECANDGVLVAARDGVIRLLSVEEGGREQPATRWFHDRGCAIGMRFDPVAPATSRWARGLRPAPESVAPAAPIAATTQSSALAVGR
jgi:methionyl-tRNA formyltransferase